MIKIEKGDPPKYLQTKGIEHTRLLIDEFDTERDRYLNGESKFQFKKTYKAKSVQKLLKIRQRNKCCYSEAYFAGDHYHVEHFRPKSRIVDFSTRHIYRKSGYYWLAYSWNNLFLCKGKPNDSYKIDYFPFLSGSLENITHHDNNLENIGLVNPSEDEPRDHIRFYDDAPVGVSERGRITIKVCGLDDIDLVKARRSDFEKLSALKSAYLMLTMDNQRRSPVDQQKVDGFRATLMKSTEPEAQFSSMAIDLLSDLFQGS